MGTPTKVTDKLTKNTDSSPPWRVRRKDCLKKRKKKEGGREEERNKGRVLFLKTLVFVLLTLLTHRVRNCTELGRSERKKFEFIFSVKKEGTNPSLSHDLQGLLLVL